MVVTPPKFNVEPENDSFQEEIPFLGTPFQVPGCKREFLFPEAMAIFSFRKLNLRVMVFQAPVLGVVSESWKT